MIQRQNNYKILFFFLNFLFLAPFANGNSDKTILFKSWIENKEDFEKNIQYGLACSVYNFPVIYSASYTKITGNQSIVADPLFSKIGGDYGKKWKYIAWLPNPDSDYLIVSFPEIQLTGSSTNLNLELTALPIRFMQLGDGGNPLTTYSKNQIVLLTGAIDFPENWPELACRQKTLKKNDLLIFKKILDKNFKTPRPKLTFFIAPFTEHSSKIYLYLLDQKILFSFNERLLENYEEYKDTDQMIGIDVDYHEYEKDGVSPEKSIPLIRDLPIMHCVYDGFRIDLDSTESKK